MKKINHYIHLIFIGFFILLMTPSLFAQNIQAQKKIVVDTLPYTTQWSKQLKREIQNNILGASLYPLVDPNHNTFVYSYLNNNLQFNQKTYNYISARVFPSPVKGCVQLSIANSFLNSYKQIMTSIKYQLNGSDKLFLQKHFELQKQQATTIVKKFEIIFDSITPKQLITANKDLKSYKITIQNKLDYILIYHLSHLWSSSKKRKKKPLPFSQMVHAKSLESLIPNMPASAAPLLSDIFLYFDYYRRLLTLENNLRYNSNTLSSALKNTRLPNNSNGGLETFDPISGEVYSFSSAYTLGNSVAGITNALNDTMRTIQIYINIPLDKKRKEENLAFNPISKKTTAPFKSENILKIKIEYKGYTFIPVSPLSYIENKQVSNNNTDQPNSWGWYFDEAINQSIRNKGCKKTGYCFLFPPPYNLGNLEEGGNFGRITGLLIANLPTVTIYLNQNNNSLPVLKESYIEGKLQIPFAQIKGQYYQYLNSSSIKNKKITFIPKHSIQLKIKSNEPLEEVTIPKNSQIAKVLMIAASFPSSRK